MVRILLLCCHNCSSLPGTVYLRYEEHQSLTNFAIERPPDHSSASSYLKVKSETSIAPSARTSTYHTSLAESPREWVPPTPVVKPLTLSSATNFAKVPHIDTGISGVSVPPQSTKHRRNIVFVGETGAGKSSAINLLLEAGTPASVSNDSQPCTQASAAYETTLNGTNYSLWDTRGLGEGRNFLQAIFRLGRSSEKDLKKFLKERHQRHELDLLVFCVRGARAIVASVDYYNKFCAITRRLAAPVVIVVTQLEKEKVMEDWWNKNSSVLEDLKMYFDDHVCITTLAGHRRLAESKKRLVELITKNRRWEAQESESYFGSAVQRTTPSAPPSTRRNLSPFRLVRGGNVGDRSLDRRPRNYPGPSSIVPSARTSTNHTALAESPRESVPSNPVVEPSTPSSAANFAKVPHIDTDISGVSVPPQSASEETSSMQSSLHSISNSRCAIIMHFKLPDLEDV